MKSRHIARPLLAVCLSAASANAFAQHIYTCRDASGRMLTSDRPIPECADRAMKEMSPGGRVVREIAAPMTAEQVRQKEADDRRKAEEEEAQREARRRDAALLAAYPTEAALEQARTRALADTRDAIKGSNERLANLMKDRAAIAKEAEPYKGKALPANLQRRSDDTDLGINAEVKTLAARNADLDRVNQRFDADLARYRALNAPISSTPPTKSAGAK